MKNAKKILLTLSLTTLPSCMCEDKKKPTPIAKKSNIIKKETPKISLATEKNDKDDPLLKKVEIVKNLYLKSKENCKIEIDSTDQMKYTSKGTQIKSININKSCGKFYIHLRHTGKLPALIMGHNILITKDTDMKSIVSESVKAGKENHYIPNNKKVLSGSHILLGGDTKDHKEDYIEIDTNKFAQNSKYKFFCSFPGHSGMMQGDIILK